jgi:hypothetical protein
MGGKSKTKTKSTTSGWEPVMDQLESTVLPGINEYTDDYIGGDGLYSGSRLGAQDPNVTNGQDALLQAATDYSQGYQGVNNTLQGFLDYDPNSYQNEAARDALGANVRAQWEESIMPGIEDMGTGIGQFGGNQQSLALGAASAPLSRAIADSEVGLMNADRDRAMTAMLNAGGVMQGGFVPGQVQEGVGRARTAREQLVQDDFVQEFEAERRNRLQSLLETQGLLAPMAGLETTSTSKTSSKASPLQTAVGIGALGLDLYGTGGLGTLESGGSALGPASINNPHSLADVDVFGLGQ